MTLWEATTRWSQSWRPRSCVAKTLWNSQEMDAQMVFEDNDAGIRIT